MVKMKLKIVWFKNFWVFWFSCKHHFLGFQTNWIMTPQDVYFHTAIAFFPGVTTSLNFGSGHCADPMVPSSIPGRTSHEKKFMWENFNVWFFWTFRHQLWRFGWSFSWDQTFCLNPFGRGVRRECNALSETKTEELKERHLVT